MWRAQLSRYVKEIRFMANEIKPPVAKELAAADSHSHVLSFYFNNYTKVKTLNPSFNYLLRESFPGKGPYMVATYGWGKNEFIDLSDLKSPEDMESIMENVISLGKTHPRSPDMDFDTPPTIVDNLDNPCF